MDTNNEVKVQEVENSTIGSFQVGVVFTSEASSEEKSEISPLIQSILNKIEDPSTSIPIESLTIRRIK